MNGTNSFGGSNHFIRIQSPAKINLHLEVLGLRNDGFHELAMVMQSIDLADCLEITNNEDGQITLTVDPPGLSTGDDNLIIRAAKLIRDSSKNKGLGARIHLQKRVPIGAGLAGGSSNGAATLVGLNSLWDLGFSRKYLCELAAELGSDMPFCLDGGTQLCFGRGEKLESLDVLPTSMAVILVKDPSVSVSTPWAYELCKELNGANYLQGEKQFETRRQKLRDANWLSIDTSEGAPPLKNDLQQVVAPKMLAVQNALNLLSELPGSIGVSMSGSGPSCFALYSSYAHAKDILDKHKSKLTASGLDSWCCSFLSQGVTLQS